MIAEDWKSVYIIERWHATIAFSGVQLGTTTSPVVEEFLEQWEDSVAVTNFCFRDGCMPPLKTTDLKRPGPQVGQLVHW